MQISRQDLIELCDKFINEEIDKKFIKDYAWNAVSQDEIEWVEDEVISKTLFEWDNEEMDYPINKVNMKLWKVRLITGEDRLMEFNFWDHHINLQKEICQKYDSKWAPINKSLRIGVSSNLEFNPIHGLRHPKDKGTTGWFLWTGEYSENEDFFHSICAEHLLQIRPEIIKYLGLDVGFRFLIDNKGYEDVWFDEKLLKI